MGKEYFECKCTDDEHRIVIEDHYFPGEDNWERENELIVSTYMCTGLGLFERIWLAIKYVFKFHHEYGHFNCTVISEEDTLKLKNVCDKVLNRKEILKFK